MESSPFSALEILKIESGFDLKEWEIIKPLAKEIILKENSVLFEEGNIGLDVYFLVDGSLEVIKKGLRIAIIEPGEWAGEIAPFTEDGKRSATIQAREESLLIKISIEDLKKATKESPLLYTSIMSVISRQIADKLLRSTDVAVASIGKNLNMARMRVAMGHFLCYVLMALGCFFFAVKIISVLKVSPRVSSVISIPLILFLSYFIFLIIKKSHFPLSTYGITLKNWKKAIFESMLATIFMIAIIIAIKWFFISNFSEFKRVPLFELPRLIKTKLSLVDWLLMTIGYALASPLQELMIRGCMQGSLTRFLIGKNKLIMAIFLSNLIFSALHLQISLQFAVEAFVCGNIWGWLYSRHHNLVGVSLSHIIIGIVGGLVVGFL